MYKHRYSIPEFAYVLIGAVPIIAAFFCFLLIFSAVLLFFSDPLLCVPAFAISVPALSGFFGGFVNVRFIRRVPGMPILSAVFSSLLYIVTALIVCNGAFSLMHFLNALTLLLSTLVASVLFGTKKARRYRRRGHSI